MHFSKHNFGTCVVAFIGGIFVLWHYNMIFFKAEVVWFMFTFGSILPLKDLGSSNLYTILISTKLKIFWYISFLWHNWVTTLFSNLQTSCWHWDEWYTVNTIEMSAWSRGNFDSLIVTIHHIHFFMVLSKSGLINGLWNFKFGAHYLWLFVFWWNQMK